MVETNRPTQEVTLLTFLPNFRHFLDLLRKDEHLSSDSMLQLLGPWMTRARPAIKLGTPDGEKELELLELLLEFLEKHGRPPTEEELLGFDPPWPVSTSWPSLLFQPDIPKEQVVGQTITRILRSEWEPVGERGWDYCRFYIESAAGNLFELGESCIYATSMSLKNELLEVEHESPCPIFWAVDGTTCVGDTIQGVFCMYTEQFRSEIFLYLELTGDRFLCAEGEEGGMILQLFDRATLLRHHPDLSPFRDYWTNAQYFQ